MRTLRIGMVAMIFTILGWFLIGVGTIGIAVATVVAHGDVASDQALTPTLLGVVAYILGGLLVFLGIAAVLQDWARAWLVPVNDKLTQLSQESTVPQGQTQRTQSVKPV